MAYFKISKERGLEWSFSEGEFFGLVIIIIVLTLALTGFIGIFHRV